MYSVRGGRGFPRFFEASRANSLDDGCRPSGDETDFIASNEVAEKERCRQKNKKNEALDISGPQRVVD